MLKRKLTKASSSGKIEIQKQSKLNDTSDDYDLIKKNQNFDPETEFFKKFINIQLELNLALKNLQFKPPVAYVYNPVEYAFKANESYVNKYCKGSKKVLFVGMNPGPFGMCQTGVPFGEIKSVRDWLKIQEAIDKPANECPKRPVLGFECPRTEVSGDRFWNLLKKLCGTPEVFFRNCFVYNYCPLALMKSDGGNLTPRDIKDRQQLEVVCDKFYAKIIQLLQPEVIVGIGEYIEKRTSVVMKDNSIDASLFRMPHPSPRAVNNQNWSEKAEKFLQDNDLLKYISE